MLSSCPVLRWVRKLTAVLMPPGLLSPTDAQNASAPTTSENPALIDQVWQQASSKYDSAREALLKRADGAKGPFHADWESLRKYEVPEWYKDAKFGIFIQLGALLGSSLRQPMVSTICIAKARRSTSTTSQPMGPPDKVGYQDFIPMFKADHYDPVAWADSFKKAGAKYVVPVAEHHDGFAMYDSGVSDWTAAQMGPHRDLGKAVRTAGLHFGVSSHRVEHNFFLGVGRTIPSDVNDPQYAAFGPAHTWLADPRGTPLDNDFTYVSSAWANDWLARATELVAKYHPDILYLDWWIGQPSIRPNLTRFAAFYYNNSLKYDDVGGINYKDFAMQEHPGVLGPRARTARRHSTALLANGHLYQQPLVGLYK